MVSIQMKDGPKGRGVIQKVFRNEFGIKPGDRVFMKDDKQSIILQKPRANAAELLEMIDRLRKKVKLREDVHPHAYEKELEERGARSQK